MKRGRAYATLPAITLLVYLFVSESPSVCLLFFGALAFHEWGHLCAFRLVGAGRPAFHLDGVGMRLCAPMPLLPWQEAVVALAGPLFNILFALLSLRLGKGSFFLLFAAVHLLFGLGNLLPFGASDGERVLELLLRRLFSRLGGGISSLCSAFFLAFFFYLSLFLFYLSGNGLCGVFFSLFFLWEGKSSFANDF